MKNSVEDKNSIKNKKSEKQKEIRINSDQKLLSLSLLHSNESDFAIVESKNKIEKGSFVIIESRYGKDLAKVSGEILTMKSISENLLANIIRNATEDDLKKYKANIELEKEALSLCKKKIKQHNLDMKLVTAHYLLHEPKLLFFFTATERVDFRILVRDLVTIFKLRIELRQIGVRDESRILGGISVCGRDYCCHNVTENLKPVSIKMAKEQNLSLNSIKISGPCGRLLCCLSYEYDYYINSRKQFPHLGTTIIYNNSKMRVSDLNFITENIMLTGNDGQSIKVYFKQLNYNKINKKWNVKKSTTEQESNTIIPKIEIK